MEISRQNVDKYLCQIVIIMIFLSGFRTPFTFGVSVEKDLMLTPEQKSSLDKFRQKVSPLLYRDFMNHDIYLVRWLRARDFDLESAELMLRSHLNRRKELKIDTILTEDWSDMRRDYHATMDTYDRTGRPVGVIDAYDWDIRRAALQEGGRRYMRYLDYLMESMTMQVFERQAKGMNVTQWTFLGNADGLNVVTHVCPICLPLWIQFLHNMQENYPGWVDEFIMIDVPSTGGLVMEAARPFLSRSTREALRIFGPNRNKWLPYLDEKIAKDQRRPQYGGTKPSLRD